MMLNNRQLDMEQQYMSIFIGTSFNLCYIKASHCNFLNELCVEQIDQQKVEKF